MHHALVATPRFPSRPRLLCLHSSASSGRQWDPMINAMSSTCEVLAPDLLGYAGERTWPIGQPMSLDAEAVALEPLLPPPSRGGAHLFGHSYGGAVALQLALRWPERVRSLTLFEPVRFALLSRHASTLAASAAIVGVGRRIGCEVMDGRLSQAAARFVDYWSGDGTWQTMSPRRRAVLSARMPKVHAEFDALFGDPMPVAAFARLTMPVQLIGGGRSPLPARQVLDLLAAIWPHATRTQLPALGHMGPVEAPLQVLACTGFGCAHTQPAETLAA